ncbi:MAG: flagellar assembly protein FliW [Firmicutes bacterium]|nr:flagellar assembly protein FliW [Bacillota bacterium]
MEIRTKYFGAVEYEQEDCLSFENGLFGFEDEKEFLLLPFDGSAGTMLSLQSTKTVELAFIVMDPFALHHEYSPELQPRELEALGVKESEELGYYVLCVVKNPVSKSTVNLKCPVAVNPETRVASQVILDSDSYEMRHPLSEFSRNKNEGAAKC